jgi:hypothetical protein
MRTVVILMAMGSFLAAIYFGFFWLVGYGNSSGGAFGGSLRGYYIPFLFFFSVVVSTVFFMKKLK